MRHSEQENAQIDGGWGFFGKSYKRNCSNSFTAFVLTMGTSQNIPALAISNCVSNELNLDFILEREGEKASENIHCVYLGQTHLDGSAKSIKALKGAGRDSVP